MTPSTPWAKTTKKPSQLPQTPVTVAPAPSSPDSAKSCIVVATWPPAPAPLSPSPAPVSPPAAVWSPTPVDVAAEIRLLESFPNGYSRIPTSAEGNLCGLHALVASLTAQVLCDPPTLADLQAIARSDEMLANELAIFDEPRSLEDSYHVDQLAAILCFWGQPRGFDLQLGYVLQSGRSVLVPGPTTPNTQVVWISSTSEDGAEAAYLDHYEGLRALDPRHPTRRPAVATSTGDRTREIPDSDAIDDESTSDEETPVVASDAAHDGSGGVVLTKQTCTFSSSGFDPRQD